MNIYNTYLGLRVFPGPSWNYQSSNFLGTVSNDEHRDEGFVGVRWDDFKVNNYAIGKNKIYDLLVYDSAQIGIKHNGYDCGGCNEKGIIGIKWGCFDCGKFLCTKCYMMDCDKAHHFYRIDSENDIGIFIGQRIDCLKYTCQGIFKDSKICETFTKKIGIVDSFVDKKNTYRSLVQMKFENNKFKKLELGYMGKVQVTLIDVNDERNIGNIYRNHLRILGRHPIFNFEYSQFYNDELKSFDFKFFADNTDFKIDDIVYVDCFDNSSLKKFQLNFGESNYKTEMLIGKCGFIKSICENHVKVYFEHIKEEFYFNSKILFKVHDNLRQMIRISKLNLTQLIDEWKNLIKLRTSSKVKDIYWIPDVEIIEKIKDKCGVIVTNTLPGDLVGVCFKLFPDTICMILPRNACIDIDKRSDTSEILSQREEFETNYRSFDKEKVIELSKLISNENLDEFTKLITDIKSNLCVEEWYQLMISATKSKNIAILNSLLEESSTQINLKRNMLFHNMISNDESFNSIAKSKEILSAIICHIDFNNVFYNNTGENILHVAVKKNNAGVVEALLEVKKDLVNYVNKINGYSALHYAVENNYYAIIEILMKYDCNIYLKEKLGDSTPLHLALKHNCFESLCYILKSLPKKNLDPTFVNKEEDCILHLSASLDYTNCPKKLKEIIDNKSTDLIKNLIEKFEKFKASSKSKNLDDFEILEMPFALVSCLILLTSEKGLQTWMTKTNKINKTPDELFSQSVKNLKLSAIKINRSFKRFYRYFENERYVEVCKFCCINDACIIYKPCGHRIHCEYCSFMPFKCSECNQDIDEKVADHDQKELITFEKWNELAKSVKESECPETLRDWYHFISKSIRTLECQICFSKNWDLVLICGHQQCQDCFNRYKKCGLCNLDKPQNFRVIWNQ